MAVMLLSEDTTKIRRPSRLTSRSVRLFHHSAVLNLRNGHVESIDNRVGSGVDRVNPVVVVVGDVNTVRCRSSRYGSSQRADCDRIANDGVGGRIDLRDRVASGVDDEDVVADDRGVTG